MGSALHVYHEYAQKPMKHNEIKHLTTPLVSLLHMTLIAFSMTLRRKPILQQ